jgi:hypothetical protein
MVVSRKLERGIRAKRGSIGPIHPKVLYRMDDLLRRMGWGEAAFYAARRRGLKTHRVGKRTYALGSDVIAYVTSQVQS